jgi:hypothetical protein
MLAIHHPLTTDGDHCFFFDYVITTSIYPLLDNSHLVRYKANTWDRYLSLAMLYECFTSTMQLSELQ